MSIYDNNDSDNKNDKYEINNANTRNNASKINFRMCQQKYNDIGPSRGKEEVNKLKSPNAWIKWVSG